MRLYITGPVTGHTDLNRPAFDAVAAHLRKLGHEVVVPHDYVPPYAPWDIAMRICVRELALCEGIVMLSGWRGSKGAKLEVDIADALGMTVLEAEA